MKVPAYIQHQIPGRARLKIPARRGDVQYFERLVAQVTSYPGIAQAHANPKTASLVIEHSGNLAEIAERAGAEDLFEVMHETLAPIVEAGQAPGQAINPDAQAFRLQGKPQMLPVLAAGFAGLGVYQLFRREVLAPATTLFWYALSAMILASARKRNQPPVV